MQAYPTIAAVSKVTIIMVACPAASGDEIKSKVENRPAPAMAGTPNRKLYRADADLSKPCERPAEIVTPLRDMPGIRANTWATPMIRAPYADNSPISRLPDNCRSPKVKTTAGIRRNPAAIGGRARESSDEISRQQSGDSCRNGSDNDVEAYLGLLFLAYVLSY